MGIMLSYHAVVFVDVECHFLPAARFLKSHDSPCTCFVLQNAHVSDTSQDVFEVAGVCFVYTGKDLFFRRPRPLLIKVLS